MNDTTIARLLAKHALGLKQACSMNYERVYIVGGDGLLLFDPPMKQDDEGVWTRFDPANVTDHAIEAAEAAGALWFVSHRYAQVVTAASIGEAKAGDDNEPRPAARLSLALIRALGVEEEAGNG